MFKKLLMILTMLFIFSCGVEPEEEITGQQQEQQEQQEDVADTNDDSGSSQNSSQNTCIIRFTGFGENVDGAVCISGESLTNEICTSIGNDINDDMDVGMMTTAIDSVDLSSESVCPSNLILQDGGSEVTYLGDCNLEAVTDDLNNIYFYGDLAYGNIERPQGACEGSDMMSPPTPPLFSTQPGTFTCNSESCPP